MVMTLEGTVENGQIHLRDDVKLREHTKVFVVVPDEEAPIAFIGSPQLVHREQAADFKKTIRRRNANESV